MAQKNISSVEGAALLVASAGNVSDFRDTRSFFKEELEKAVKNATSKDQVIRIYQEAVSGFLMEKMDLSCYADKIKLAQEVRVLTKECLSLTKRVCLLGFGLISLAGVAVAAIVKLIMM